MRLASSTVLSLLVFMALAAGLASARGQAPAPAPASAARDTTTTTWYFYKVRWGHQDEFLNLFQKNHYPVLKALQEGGRYASIRTYVPRYHGDGRADWTFAVELVARENVPNLPSEQEVVRKLFPDQATFQKEERRRFEILDAHWDVPLNPVDLDAREMTN